MIRKSNIVLTVEDKYVYSESHSSEFHPQLIEAWFQNDDLRQIVEDRHPELLKDDMAVYQVFVFARIATSTEDIPLGGTYEYPFPDVTDSWYVEVTEANA